MSDEQESQQYLQSQVHPILHKLVTDLLINRPQEPVSYIQKWMETNGDEFIPHGGINQAATLQSLNKAKSQKKKKENEEHVSSEQSDEDDEVFEIDPKILEKKKQQQPAGRTSVSAEAFGKFNQKGAFKARVIPKNAAQKERIIKRMNQAFMFAALEQKDRDIVINAMEEKKFKAGDWVIKQGEDGAELYIVDTGELDCYKKFTKDQVEPTFLKKYVSGESFGELSLLYNAPRAASIKATNQSVLFALDRDTFNNIVKDAAAKKRERFENFLKSVDILQEMDPYERSKIADALVVVKAQQGETVIREGDEGDVFFMIEQGELQARKIVQPGEPAKVVLEYGPGQYFGELALLKNTTRQASVICKTDCLLVSLDRFSFKRLLGPIDEILKRNTDKYQKFQNK